MKTTFIYALCEPGTRTVRYIGKANNPKARFNGHMSRSMLKHNHLGCWLRSVLSSGGVPTLIILREVPQDQWQLAEERYIRLGRAIGLRLVNTTSGGEGLNNPTSEFREKMSLMRLGRKASEETRLKMSRAHTGFRHSLETRAKLSEMKRGVPPSPATLLAKKKSLETWACSEETRQKISRAMRGRKYSGETLRRMSAAQSGSNHHNFGKKLPQETRDKLKAAQTARRLREKGAF